MSDTSLRYQDAGVNIDAGNRLVNRIKTIAARTQRPEMLQGIGGFAALFELPIHRYKKPVLVSSTDGVGTKLKLAIQLNRYNTIGIDLVAMCVNDLIVMGAEPLFFLDYYACGQLNEHHAAQIIEGISQGCLEAGAALVGGETAEMPGLYAEQDYDLAGFCVGIVEKDHLIDGNQVKVGDVLIGIASSGIHSNGYSLVHKILQQQSIALSTPFAGKTLGDILLTPTKIYVRSIQDLIKQQIPLHAIAHITGGGLLENLPRVLPIQCQAIIQRKSWPQPEIFTWLQQQGNIAESEMLRTFNCGVGMVICVAPETADICLRQLHQCGETAWIIGEIQTRAEHQPAIVIA